jgi:hypothetical protein
MPIPEMGATKQLVSTPPPSIASGETHVLRATTLTAKYPGDVGIGGRMIGPTQASRAPVAVCVRRAQTERRYLAINQSVSAQNDLRVSH